LIRDILVPHSSGARRVRPIRLSIAFPFPSPGNIDDCSGCFNLHQGFKRLTHDGTLLINVIRFTHRVPERPLEEDRPGRFNLLRILPDNGYSDGGYTGSLDTPLDQSHGLIADSSTRCQQYIVHFLLLQSGSYLRGTHLHERVDVRPQYVTHECIVGIRYFSDNIL